MDFTNILEYKHWSDRRILDAVAQLTQEEQQRALDFARQQLNHMVRVEELFQARLRGVADPHDSTNTEHLPELAELEGRLMAANQWLLTYAKSLSASQLKEDISFTFVDGKRGRLSREEVIFHLINHGTYHRGAIGHALDLAVGTRPADTYNVFIHAAEPERRN
ncbi:MULTISPECIES: DinB family protein [unclassified Herbaspirillum]|uniref:DinB family protein n=1 Tax=unclassified Herbaspirillum TaxID=2624150 RepID=UPI000C092E63|nr:MULTISPECIES: DinB family protein [unclassified Herbaspirillum]MAF04069.1 damage-inducible protein DinB [Herbaspirillum sp.]MBO16528.1 damage-inducible protein DinB [Herbaspirillum sp.]|tara:strand:+ start:32 stop:523 length:492 start_codon:yes stop_codon:yes gene_type:complete